MPSPPEDLFDEQANRLLNRLHEELDGERRRLLEKRQEVRAHLRNGGTYAQLFDRQARSYR